ncbi:hypothetical protein VAEKB19_3280050 [Vibrio aestuarianus]|nr:hypothetical protein VAEKB19_3280050 [Vibrio aestuarianus]
MPLAIDVSNGTFPNTEMIETRECIRNILLSMSTRFQLCRALVTCF